MMFIKTYIARVPFHTSILPIHVRDAHTGIRKSLLCPYAYECPYVYKQLVLISYFSCYALSHRCRNQQGGQNMLQPPLATSSQSHASCNVIHTCIHADSIFTLQLVPSVQLQLYTCTCSYIIACTAHTMAIQLTFITCIVRSCTNL